MKFIFKVLIFISIGFGVFNMATTVSVYWEKVVIDEILEKGNKKIGVVEYVDAIKRDEIKVRVDDKIISKKVVESENYHRVGDTVVLYNYPRYSERYMFRSDDIAGLAVVVGFAISIIFLSPVVLLLKKK